MQRKKSKKGASRIIENNNRDGGGGNASALASIETPAVQIARCRQISQRYIVKHPWVVRPGGHGRREHVSVGEPPAFV